MYAQLSILAAVAALGSVSAQNTGVGNPPDLINARYPWPYSGPFQIDTSNGPRGLMQGYNQCNSTTQGQSSMCVNMVANNISDFCLYAPATLSSIADTEGETVAWCTKSGYGTRVIPGGAITGLQVVKTPGYLAIAGFLADQQQVDIITGDAGGELDPHGADNRGNPIGSLVYSTAFSGTTGGNSSSNYQQIIEWNVFIGGNQFCMKFCNPANANAAQNNNLCLNIYDTVGCNGNVPLNYAQINGTFSYCQGDNQQVPNGSALPIPATSMCTTYASTALFAAATPVSSSASMSSSASVSTSMPSGSSIIGGSGTSRASSASSTGVSSSSARSAAVAVVGVIPGLSVTFLAIVAAVVFAAAVAL